MEIIEVKNIDYDTMDYLNRTNKKIIVTMLDGNEIQASVGKFYNDLIFHGKFPNDIQHSHYSIQKKSIKSIKITN